MGKWFFIRALIGLVGILSVAHANWSMNLQTQHIEICDNFKKLMDKDPSSDQVLLNKLEREIDHFNENQMTMSQQEIYRTLDRLMDIWYDAAVLNYPHRNFLRFKQGFIERIEDYQNRMNYDNPYLAKMISKELRRHEKKFSKCIHEGRCYQTPTPIIEEILEKTEAILGKTRTDHEDIKFLKDYIDETLEYCFKYRR